MTRLLADMLKDALNEFSYDAVLAGLEFKCNNTIYGIDVRTALFCVSPC